MSGKKAEVTYNVHYHCMMPMGMAPMESMYGAGQMAGMPDMYGSWSPVPDYMNGSHLDGNPHDGLFFRGPFFSPFFFRRRFFPFFFPFFFFPFF